MEKEEAKWLTLFTGGQISLIAVPMFEEKDVKKANAEVLLAKDEERCRKLREAELARSMAVVNDAKQAVKEGLDMKFEVDGKKTKTADKGGDATKVFDSDEASRITSDQTVKDENGKKGAYSQAYLKAMNNFRPLADESQRLRELIVVRNVWNGEGDKKKLVEEKVPLFEDAQIMKE